MAEYLERELKIPSSSLGINVYDPLKNRWSMHREILDCIVRNLKHSVYSVKSVVVTKTEMKGSGTVYIFEFSPRYEKSGRQSFMLSFTNGLKIEVDLGEVEVSLQERERTQKIEDVVKARLDMYEKAITSCGRPTAPSIDIDTLAEGMKKMAVGGRKTRRQRKRRLTRRS